MRVLITGVKGQLGAELVRALTGRAEIIGRDLPEFDIAAPHCAEAVAALEAEWVIHAAAATDVDGCERDPVITRLGRALDGLDLVAEDPGVPGADAAFLVLGEADDDGRRKRAHARARRADFGTGASPR